LSAKPEKKKDKEEERGETKNESKERRKEKRRERARERKNLGTAGTDGSSSDFCLLSCRPTWGRQSRSGSGLTAQNGTE
jgi:hypothetical protein